eukprot:gb/GECH01012432.1/.p1 GENE.gb/GECH01012432.1/~~gb/GECH01012432.1/.p1  ORF type:complete len:861 (+),score=178.12 gb/GECH01012432.1/:1-2583(+)
MTNSNLTSKDEQKRIIKKLENESKMQVGDTYYMLSTKWWKDWSKYVGYDPIATKEAKHPGPIDNTPLLNGDKLKRQLAEYYEYHLVSETEWNQFLEWYGGGPAIPRQVIQEGISERKVEVYPLPLKLMTLHPQTHKPDATNIKSIEISKSETVANLKQRALDTFAIQLEPNRRSRLHIYYGPGSMKVIDKKSKTLEDAFLVPGTRVLLEVQSSSGDWHIQEKQNDYTLPTTRSSFWNRSTQRGLCGLPNLGNTCFMNSSLQCLSNTRPLTEYFISGQYKKEINRQNPLGMQGNIAEQYGELINKIWSGKHSSVSPSKFKWTIGRFAPQFTGYAQHDSQELLAFLLDGLHEDLNRIQNKPWVEMKESDGRDDALVAKESWERHLLRNKSIIVNLFQGQLKSTVECPHCDKVSITFDPFMYLSLPLPSTKLVELMVTFFNSEGKRPTKYAVKAKKAGTVLDVKEKLAPSVGVPSSELLIALRHGKDLERFPSDNMSVKQLQTERQIMVYHVPSYERFPHYVQASFTHRHRINKVLYGNFQFEKLVIPFASRIAPETTGNQLYAYVWKMCRRYTNNDNNNNGDKQKDSDDGSQVNDMEIDDDNSTAAIDALPDELPFDLWHVHHVLSSGTKIPRNNEPLNFDQCEVQIAIDWGFDGKSKYLNISEACLQNVDPQANRSSQKGRDSTDVKECISLFTEREQLGTQDTWYCPQCKDHVQAFKHFDLWKLPDILVVHLKRFQYSRYNRSKLATFVDFPIEGLDLTCFEEDDPVIYDLYAVSNHSGGLGGGHYTAYVKNSKNGKWFLFNDSSVSPASEDHIKSNSAYVLFYQRRYPRNLEQHQQQQQQQAMDAEDDKDNNQNGENGN